MLIWQGIPRPIIDAMAEKGIDENSIFAAEHTEALQEVLKTIKFDVLAGKGKPINVKAAMPVEKPNSQLSTGIRLRFGTIAIRLE